MAVEATDPAREPRHAYVRLAAALTLITIGTVGMYAVVVALRPIALEFGVSRSAASLAYAATMIGFGERLFERIATSG